MTEYRPSTETITGASELSTALTQLGLGQYEERLRENGFEDWENATAIKEPDLEELGFKLGDRKLQRAIRGHNNTLITTQVSMRHKFAFAIRRTTHRWKTFRDSNGPLKPKTAYVLFGEHVRQDPALSRSSFTELAKETGKRWSEIPHEERRNNWETPTADRLQEYKEELEQYKQTANYRTYYAYLEEFKQGRHKPTSTMLPEIEVPCTSAHAPPSLLPASQAQEELEATDEEHFGLEDVGLEDQLQNMTSPVQWGMEEVHHTSKALGVSLHLVKFAAFPLEHLTTQAVKAFLQGTGSLLYLWDHEEALSLVKSVYHPDRDTTPVYASEVFAMSSVGSYCDGDAHFMLPRKEFLDFFLYMLSSPFDMCDLRRMRLLLAWRYAVSLTVWEARGNFCQQDIVDHMEYMELQTMPDMHSIDMQPEIQCFMRLYLLDFLIEAHAAFQLLPETLFLAVNLLDRYCSRRFVYKRHYQLVGCAAMLIAAKYGDKKDHVPSVRELELMCCSLYDDEVFIQMERHVLQTLNWILGHPTIDAFLQVALAEEPFDPEVEHMSSLECPTTVDEFLQRQVLTIREDAVPPTPPASVGLETPELMSDACGSLTPRKLHFSAAVMQHGYLTPPITPGNEQILAKWRPTPPITYPKTPTSITRLTTRSNIYIYRNNKHTYPAKPTV
ncbi:cyclin domain-containing protein [Paraphaeosphaeria sporulosa]